MSRIERLWEDAWFREVDARPLAAARVAIGLVVALVFTDYLRIGRDAFSGSGWLQADGARLLMDQWAWSLFHVWDGPAFVTGTLVVGAACGVLVALGLWTRLALIVALVVLQSAQVRNPAVLYGSDLAARVFVFHLALSRCAAAWSIDAVRARLRAARDGDLRTGPEKATTIPVWPQRLMQVQIAIIYFASGISKAMGDDYVTGEALWYALANSHYARFPGLEVVFGRFPLLFKLPTWATLAWEIAFPFLILLSATRRLALIVGVGFHLGILLLLGVGWWSPIMLAAYLVFVDPRRLHALWLRHVRETRHKRWHDRLTLLYDPDDAAARRFAAAASVVNTYQLVRFEPDPGADAPIVVTRRADAERVAPGQATATLRRALGLGGWWLRVPRPSN